MPEPIDYARAESDDVVRKKFRRRVVWFVVATVVVMGIGGGWRYSSLGGTWSIGNSDRHEMFIFSEYGWICLWGPSRSERLKAEWQARRFESHKVGIFAAQHNMVGFSKWDIAIRYRTLLLLALIPWLITLIRLIRIWKKRKVLSPEC